jgi:alternate signal-mediated exported protein
MRTTNSKKSTVKGTVAVAAGIAVLLGGAGTFALWNQSGSIGTSGTQTGELEASFDAMTWKDVTPNGTAHGVDPTTFHMVPGDVLEGTTEVDYRVDGDNIVVEPEVAHADGGALTFLSDDALTVTTSLEDSGGTPVATLHDGDSGTLTAKVTIAYDEDGANGTGDVNMVQDIDLQDVSLVLQQQAPQNLP